MVESQWQKKKKRKRSQSRNNGLHAEKASLTSNKSNSGSKSLLERLQAVIAVLQQRTCLLDLRTDGPAWVKLATQVVTSEQCSLKEGCMAACLVTHLLRRCSSSEGQRDTGGKLQMNPQHLLPFAKAMASRIAPSSELHLPYLVLLSQLLVAHPGICISLRSQLEENLLPWLNYPWCSGETTDNKTSSVAVSLAGDVWSLLPVSSSTAGPHTEDMQGAYRGGTQRSAVVAAARGRQLQQLMTALQVQLNRLLVGVVQIQGAHTTHTTTDALNIPPIVVSDTHAPTKKFKHAGSHHKALQQPGQDFLLGEDVISDPIALVEMLVHRCCNILVFCERMLRSVACGSNIHGVTLTPQHLLLPMIRVLQVSPASLQRYSTTEVTRLSQLWPRLHRTTLSTLSTAITTLDHNLTLWFPTLQRQLVSTLMAVADLRGMQQHGRLPSHKMASADSKIPQQKQHGRLPSHKMASADPKILQQKQHGRLPSHKMAYGEEAAELQDIVRLIYKCLANLMEVSRGTLPVEVGLLKEVMQDLTVQPSTLVTLQNLSRKSIANMSIKKKSKKKGYTIVTTSNTAAAAAGDDEDFKVPLCIELSEGIVYHALELLQHVVSSSTVHYTLTVDCARLLHDQLPIVARYFISQWRIFPHTLLGSGLYRSREGSLCPPYLHGGDYPCSHTGGHHGSPPAGGGGGGVSYDAVSGRTDLRCFFMGPWLLDKLIRLVSLLGTGGTPQLPPHTTQLLHLLQGAQLQLQRSHQLRATAEYGTRPLRFLLAQPAMASFTQAVEDMKAASFSAVAEATQRSCDEVDGDDDDDDDDDEEESEASASDGEDMGADADDIADDIAENEAHADTNDASRSGDSTVHPCTDAGKSDENDDDDEDGDRSSESEESSDVEMTSLIQESHEQEHEQQIESDEEHQSESEEEQQIESDQEHQSEEEEDDPELQSKKELEEMQKTQKNKKKKRSSGGEREVLSCTAALNGVHHEQRLEDKTVEQMLAELEN